MQVKTLQWKRVTRMPLVVLMISIIGTMNANTHHDANQNEDPEKAFYDFSAVCSTGQTLFYKITNHSLHYVELHPQKSGGQPYGTNPPTGNIVLPSTVERNGITYTVTGIAENTFKSCHGLTGDLVIPNTVTTIGGGAFGLCTGFNGTLTLSSALQSIGSHAFQGCCNLHGDLIIPDGDIHPASSFRLMLQPHRHFEVT